MRKRNGIKVMGAISILMFARMSLASNGNDILLTQAKQISGPLPQVIGSEKNPITPEKVKLGKMLFYETRISVDGTVSCSRCHPIGLYAADGLRKSMGNNCKVNPRNAPTLFNAAGQISAHWIGNRADVEDQAKQSVIGPPTIQREYGTSNPQFRRVSQGEVKSLLRNNIHEFSLRIVKPYPERFRKPGTLLNLTLCPSCPLFNL